MIDVAISHIASELNQYIRRTFSLSEDMVVISNLLELDGTVSAHVNNKLALFLVNVEKDNTPQQQAHLNAPGVERSVVSTPPLYLNLYLMVAGNFNGSNYSEGLKFVSTAVSFFQRQPVMDRYNTPALDKRIEKLVLDIENMNMQDLSSMWGMLGGKYLPSVLYKVRVVMFDAGDIQSQSTLVKKPGLAVGV
ncbi:MAG: DUF4255 domain-containing protein [Gammaproteobacteria bacterium]|nr:DUF4255 domain-containing protein [Gammaproteobacteria bacterium]MCF6260302.1 DUF4255 domain-containing protein [Gammaproteobacteria bacterium]